MSLSPGHIPRPKWVDEWMNKMIWTHASPVTDLRKYPLFNWRMWFQGPTLEGTIPSCHLYKRELWSWAGHNLTCRTWRPWGQINSCLHRWSVLLSVLSIIGRWIIFGVSYHKTKIMTLGRCFTPTNQRNPFIYAFTHLMNSYWVPPTFWVLIATRKLLIWWLRGIFSNHFPGNFS